MKEDINRNERRIIPKIHLKEIGVSVVEGFRNSSGGYR
jgi:hypothetical protein